jgi:hypothetical protein
MKKEASRGGITMGRARRWNGTWLGAIALAALVGCQGPTAVGPLASLNLGAVAPEAEANVVSAPAAVPLDIAGVAAPVVPVAPAAAPTPAPIARSGGGSRGRRNAPAAPTGSLTVDLAPVLESLQPAAQRRILATVNDIDRLVVTISMSGLPDRVTEVSRAELDAGTTAVPFTGLPTGTCTVLITAKAADGTVIGTSSRVAPIAESQVTAVAVRVLIVPADGGYYTYANSLIFGVDLAAAPVEQAPDGSGPVSGTVVESYPIWTIQTFHPGMPGLYADGAGHFYTRHVYLSSNQSFAGVNRFSTADGSAQGSYMMMAGGMRSPVTPIVYDPAHGVLLAGSHLDQTLVVRDPADTSVKVVRGAYASPSLAVDAAGDAFYLKGGFVVKETATAVTTTSMAAFSTFRIDSAGHFWANKADTVGYSSTLRNEVLRYSADGTLLSTYPLPFPAARLVSDGEGGMWVADRPGGQLLRVQADGTVGAPIGVAANDFCLDAARNLWVATPTTLLKLAPDGLQLGNYPIKAKALAFGDGFVFAGVDGAQAVLKITP